MEAKDHEPKVRVQTDPGNAAEAEEDEHKRNASPFLELVCEHCGALHRRRSSECDLPETQLDCFFMNRKTGQRADVGAQLPGLRVSCQFDCAVNKSQGDFPVRVVCRGRRKRVVLSKVSTLCELFDHRVSVENLW